jgi:hypothetical protein
MKFLPIIGILSFFFPFSIFAQDIYIQSAVHFDRSLYVNGDTAWFSVNLPENLEYKKNSILRVQVLTSDKFKLIDEFYLKINEDKKANGYLAIPYTINSGTYLVKFIVWNENNKKSVVLITHCLHLINDESEIRPNELSFLHSDSSLNIKEYDLNFEIKLNQSIYKPRENIKMEIISKENKASTMNLNFSVSISRKSLFSSQKSYFENTSYSSILSDPFSVGGDIMVTAIFKDLNTNDFLKRSYLYAFIENDGLVSAISTDANGHALLNLKPNVNGLNIQFYDPFKRNFSVGVEKIIFKESSKVKDVNFDINKINSFQVQSRKQKKIKYLFEEYNNYSAPKNPSWQFEADQSVQSSDYISFKSLREFMETISSPFKIINYKGELRPKLINGSSKGVFPESPIFLINRELASFDEVLALEINNINYIDFYNIQETLKRFGQMGKNGIVALYTYLPVKLSDFDQSIQTVGIQQDKNYPVQFYNSRSYNTPALNPTVYWNPRVTMKTDGKININFLHGDDVGQYEIELLGRDSNGKLGSKMTSYEVLYNP